ncbi:von Willebrand factor A domain-containing protein 7-like [Lingula anatina]|uniref:von Willebrand factor A domain-containing protein 7-like n=1 Tax=Lingula anatina TaxID=7574 RepID=A0A1S3IN83_LINAN|nr:von Willebrand factor A domain-containing protein 7-like [Lingula anatina]|eukprot:XP_013399700.1 von Willebrand factor A domain-containing protein 7-like [Lingula anatina]
MEETKWSFLIFCVLCLVVFTSGFLPNHDNDFGNSPTASNYKHDDITESALLRVIARLLEDTPKPDGTKVAKGTLTGLKYPTPQRLFDAYYGKGQVLAKKLQESIETVIKFNAIVDKEHRGEALFHFNGEQIKEGFEKLSAARELFKGLAKARNANFDVLRRLLGVILHMIQDFYSNTNWIEMKGSVVYQDLGIKGKPILPVASPGIMTCRSCSWQCRNNIVLTGGVLTSGYRTGQDIQKPDSKFKSRGIGKCSHGGESDADSKVKTATGGINKETTVEKLSPHYYLHSDAGKTAVRATEMYIDGQGIGLRQKIGDASLRKLFQLTTGNSLVFVIDTTGSMSDEVAAVKQETLKIIQNTKGKLNAPSEYVLATFNDPASLTEVRVTTDPDVMISWMQAIRVTGGDDCPEFLLSGMIEAVKVCQPDSEMFVFTDADAKDPERTSEFIALATAKRVSPQFILTGKCSRRRKRTAYTGDNFVKLSSAVGGTIFTTSKAEINDTVKIISVSSRSYSVYGNI